MTGTEAEATVAMEPSLADKDPPTIAASGARKEGTCQNSSVAQVVAWRRPRVSVRKRAHW